MYITKVSYLLKYLTNYNQLALTCYYHTFFIITIITYTLTFTRTLHVLSAFARFFILQYNKEGKVPPPLA